MNSQLTIDYEYVILNVISVFFTCLQSTGLNILNQIVPTLGPIWFLFSGKVPFVNGFTMTKNYVFRSSDNFLSDLYVKSLSLQYIIML